MAEDSPLKISFEFFPPKTEVMEQTLWDTVTTLAPMAPSFVSVTYGAGGSTRERTHATLARILNETKLKPAAHLTCVDASREQVNEVIQAYWDLGVRHIVALRGDPAAGLGTQYIAHPQGYQTTAELVAGIKAIAPFEVTVSAYPEKHPESPTWAHDLDVLATKVDAGATRAITQFFFYNDMFEAYAERVAKRGIQVELIPAIAPVHNFTQLSRFAEKCGTSIPNHIARRFEGLEASSITHQLVAAVLAAEQVHDMQRRGFNTFHFYTMNRAELVYAICHLLGLRPVEGMIASNA